MMFVEFIVPVKKSSQPIKCLCALYYLKHNLQVEIATVDQIKNLLIQGRIFKKGDKTNYGRALDRLEEKVDNPQKGMWQITPTGEQEVRSLLDFQEEELEAINDTTYLESLIDGKIQDGQVKEYFSEGTDCLKVGRLRACIVFLWVGTIYEIQNQILNYPIVDVKNALLRHDSKSRTIKTIDDFAHIKESIQLLAAKELGIFDKNEYSTLNELLNLRNKCGHPSKYSPGPKRVAAFIEDIVTIVF
jgi:hypothetical protein